MKKFFTKQNLFEFFIEGLDFIDSFAILALMVLTGVYIADNDPELYREAKELIAAGGIPLFASLWLVMKVSVAIGNKIYDRYYPETEQEPA